MRLPYTKLAPEGLKAMGDVYAYVLRSGLDKSLVNLAYLRASQLNGCAYCIDAHSHDLLSEGAEVQKLMLLMAWREAGPVFDDRERAALGWTEAVTRVSHGHVPDSEFEAARAIFSEKELVDLTIAIGLINGYNRLGISFRNVPTVRTASPPSRLSDAR